MAVTSGFFNANMVNDVPDRKYYAEQLSSIFDGIVTDGVLSAVGSGLAVSAYSGMQIHVGSGRAWFNHTWTLNDAPITLDVTAAPLTLSRIDTVVLEVNRTSGVRANSIKMVDGTASSTPVPPTLVNTDDVHQYPLADISVTAGATEVKQSDITNRIGTSDTPLVTGLLQQLSIDAIVAQWQAQFSEWSEEQEAEFQAWFDGLEIVLSGDVATNLANQQAIHPDTIALYESMGWTDPGANATNS